MNHAHLGVSLLTTVGTAAFAWNQNNRDVVGGPIHWSKAMWLNITLITFIVLPFAWWRSSSAGSVVRRALGVLAGSFVLRGAIELVLVYQKPPKWKCQYGIGHDALAFAMLGGALLRDRAQLDGARDGRAVAFSGFTLAMLVVEGVFATRFRMVQDPATGIYFADDSERFRKIIRMTKTVVFVAYPLLGLILWLARRDFPRGGPPVR